MNSQNPFLPTLSAQLFLIGFLAGFLWLSSWEAQAATAPRINAQMFGDEKQAEIVGYELSPLDAAAKKEAEMTTEIITEAFSAAGVAPTLEILPSKQLASYALTNHDAVGFVGSLSDLTIDPKTKYHTVALALRGNEAISLILSSSKRGDELYKAFNQGLQQLIKNGKYATLLEKYFGQGQVPADYLSRLKQQNPSWK